MRVRGEPASLTLRESVERLVLGFSWDGRGRFVMVTEIGPPPNVDRALARFVFEGVKRFRRDRGSMRGLGEALEHRWGPDGPTFVVQGVWKRGDLLHISFGGQLGGVAFGSTQPQVEQLLLDARPEGTTWRYAVHGTREEIDLHAVLDAWT
jgi:hypothetical protein